VLIECETVMSYSPTREHANRASPNGVMGLRSAGLAPAVMARERRSGFSCGRPEDRMRPVGR